MLAKSREGRASRHEEQAREKRAGDQKRRTGSSEEVGTGHSGVALSRTGLCRLGTSLGQEYWLSSYGKMENIATEKLILIAKSVQGHACGSPSPDGKCVCVELGVYSGVRKLI